jgi:hypothetical protein
LNSVLFGILNGVATAARTNNDMSTMNILNEFYARMITLGTTYDSATTSSSPIYLQTPPPYNLPVAGSYDAQQAQGVTNIRLMGG